jgi:hypothetical protein
VAVAFDAVSSASVANNAGTALTWTHTPSGTPTAVAVAVQRYPNTFGATVTYGGVAMTLAASDGSLAGVINTEIWGLANPPSGAQTVSVGTGITGDYMEAGAITVTGSDTTTCFSNSISANGTSAAPSVSVTSASGELVVDIVSTKAGEAQRCLGRFSFKVEEFTLYEAVSKVLL